MSDKPRDWTETSRGWRLPSTGQASIISVEPQVFIEDALLEPKRRYEGGDFFGAAFERHGKAVYFYQSGTGLFYLWPVIRKRGEPLGPVSFVMSRHL